MKRLFWLKTDSGKSAVKSEQDGSTVYFQSKAQAKGIRDTFNLGKGERCRVVIGPDHWRVKE